VIDELLLLYEAVIAEHAAVGKSDWVAESRAAAEYLQWLSPRIKENDRLRGERDWIKAEHNKLQSRVSSREREMEVLEIRHASKTAQLEELISESRKQALELTGEVAIRNAELSKITRTLSWRLLSRYGKIKYRFLLPAYEQLQRMFRGRL